MQLEAVAAGDLPGDRSKHQLAGMCIITCFVVAGGEA